MNTVTVILITSIGILLFVVYFLQKMNKRKSIVISLYDHLSHIRSLSISRILEEMHLVKKQGDYDEKSDELVLRLSSRIIPSLPLAYETDCLLEQTKDGKQKEYFLRSITDKVFEYIFWAENPEERIKEVAKYIVFAEKKNYNQVILLVQDAFNMLEDENEKKGYKDLLEEEIFNLKRIPVTQ